MEEEIEVSIDEIVPTSVELSQTAPEDIERSPESTDVIETMENEELSEIAARRS